MIVAIRTWMMMMMSRSSERHNLKHRYEASIQIDFERRKDIVLSLLHMLGGAWGRLYCVCLFD